MDLVICFFFLLAIFFLYLSSIGAYKLVWISKHKFSQQSFYVYQFIRPSTSQLTLSDDVHSSSKHFIPYSIACDRIRAGRLEVSYAHTNVSSKSRTTYNF